jgi:hypothetical protein
MTLAAGEPSPANTRFLRPSAQAAWTRSAARDTKLECDAAIREVAIRDVAIREVAIKVLPAALAPAP